MGPAPLTSECWCKDLRGYTWHTQQGSWHIAVTLSVFISFISAKMQLIFLMWLLTSPLNPVSMAQRPYSLVPSWFCTSLLHSGETWEQMSTGLALTSFRMNLAFEGVSNWIFCFLPCKDVDYTHPFENQAGSSPGTKQGWLIKYCTFLL